MKLKPVAYVRFGQYVLSTEQLILILQLTRELEDGYRPRLSNRSDVFLNNHRKSLALPDSKMYRGGAVNPTYKKRSHNLS